MNERLNFRIDIAAAKALIDWKSRFAHEVVERAKGLAAESSQPERVTLSHYRQAAQSAVRALEASILDGGASGDDQKAA